MKVQLKMINSLFMVETSYLKLYTGVETSANVTYHGMT